MPAYLVTLPNTGGRALRHGADAMVVFAASDTVAKEMAASQYGGDSAWSDATATAILTTTDFNGYTLRIRVEDPDGTTSASVSVTGDATNNTIDELAALAVTALNATAVIATAAYDGTTNILTVAAAGDNLGDNQLSVEFIPPGADKPVASLVGAIVDGGVVAAALTVAFPADAATPPKVQTVYKQVV